MPCVAFNTDSAALVSASRPVRASPCSGCITCTVIRSDNPLCQPWAARVATSEAPNAKAARNAITAMTKVERGCAFVARQM